MSILKPSFPQIVAEENLAGNCLKASPASQCMLYLSTFVLFQWANVGYTQTPVMCRHIKNFWISAIGFHNFCPHRFHDFNMDKTFTPSLSCYQKKGCLLYQQTVSKAKKSTSTKERGESPPDPNLKNLLDNKNIRHPKSLQPLCPQE